MIISLNGVRVNYPKWRKSQVASPWKCSLNRMDSQNWMKFWWLFKNILEDLTCLVDIFPTKKLDRKNSNAISSRENILPFGSPFWIHNVEQNKMAVFSKSALFWVDREDLSFDIINHSVIGYLTNLRKWCSNYFLHLDSLQLGWVVNPFSCEISDVPKQHEWVSEVLLELLLNHEASIEFQNNADLSFLIATAAKAKKCTWGSDKNAVAVCNNLSLLTRIL